MSSVLAKVFMFIFVVVAITGFVVFLSMIQQTAAPADATINTSLNAYYDAQQQVNKSINQSMQYGQAAVVGLSPLPIFLMIIVIAGALMVLLVVTKRK